MWPYTSYKLSEMYQRYMGKSVPINTKLGPIVGTEVTSQFGYKYTGFQGIPYGRPPVGELRFRDPEPAEPWTHPLQANTESMACQRDIIFKRTAGTEDCLHVNVYTKNVPPSDETTQSSSTSSSSTILQPVMVWFHGGAFIFGSNTKDIYNPEFLLRQDVVVVVINYRLGALGEFLICVNKLFCLYTHSLFFLV